MIFSEFTDIFLHEQILFSSVIDIKHAPVSTRNVFNRLICVSALCRNTDANLF